MKNYKATELDALESELPGVPGYKILTVPPPAGGVALINILNILKGEFSCFFWHYVWENMAWLFNI